MTSRVSRLCAGPPALLAVAVLLAGCGGDAPRRPNLSSVPLVPGGRVVVRANACDVGANAYCALDVVFVNPHFKSAQDLVTNERRWLKRRGWIRVSAQTGDELAADSPTDRLRVTYSTAALDLKDIDLGWIKRPRPIALALSDAIYDGAPAISINVVAGPS
ncbi:MAG TPA: hypothetical protein VG186_17805 [Solirubrobacteraceae bacterium]|jgi:hypothetical protein|nr:hypothetical protein [Solirubrobacteraceae bacterium]